MLPWIDLPDQRVVFPDGQTFSSHTAQEEAIHAWCQEHTGADLANLPLQIRWYRANYAANVRSIFPAGDCSQELGADLPRDVLILEEPEHLCWYHHGRRWPELFQHVVGIVHTNYQDYLIQHKSPGGDAMWQKSVPNEIKEASVFAASTVVCSAYCDVNIKLSDALMPLPNEVICNVHGVREDFLHIGDCLRQGSTRSRASSPPPTAAHAYYLGKAILEKGWGELLDLLDAAGRSCGDFAIDGFGSGADYEQIHLHSDSLGRRGGARLELHPGADHAEVGALGYAVLLNPSTSDVLCTVTAEALAMGKRCVLAQHPSNQFFEKYFRDRCWFFEPGDATGFATAARAALAAGPPAALPPEQRQELTWEAAVERLFSAAEVRVLAGRCLRPSEAAVSRMAYQLHHALSEDGTIPATLIKEATLGENTPWEKYLSEWRGKELGRLEERARSVQKALRREGARAPEDFKRYWWGFKRMQELADRIAPVGREP